MTHTVGMLTDNKGSLKAWLAVCGANMAVTLGMVTGYCYYNVKPFMSLQANASIIPQIFAANRLLVLYDCLSQNWTWNKFTAYCFFTHSLNQTNKSSNQVLYKTKKYIIQSNNRTSTALTADIVYLKLAAYEPI